MSDNILKKIGDAAVNYAPTISKFLSASGVGAPAGIAVDVLASIGKAFGLGSNATPDEIHAAISSDPQAALKFALAEQDFQLKQGEQRLKELETRLGDIQSARQMNIEETKATGKRSKNLIALAWLNILGFYAILSIFIFMVSHGKSIEALGAMGTILIMLIGNLSSNFTSVNAFFFGSSQESAHKTDLLSKADPIKQ